MKKTLFFALTGMAILTGCSSDETVDAVQGSPIKFQHAYVNNSGRGAILTVDNFKNCKLWGSSSAADSYIFDNMALNIQGAQSVSYSPLKYWTANSQYYFMAIGSTALPADAKWTYTRPDAIPTAAGTFGSMTMDIYGANGDEDVAFASAAEKIEASIPSNKYVPLNFKHALSRIRVGIINAIADNYRIQVSNVKISGLATNGTLTFGENPTWTTPENSNTLELVPDITGINAEQIANGLESTCDYKFVIPGAYSEFTISFDLDLFVEVKPNENEEGQFVKVNDTPYHQSVAVANHTFVMNNAYKFNATITANNVDPNNPLEPIRFSASVETWETPDGNNVNVNVPAETPENP